MLIGQDTKTHLTNKYEINLLLFQEILDVKFILLSYKKIGDNILLSYKKIGDKNLNTR